MDDKGVSGSKLFVPQERSDEFCSMYFGVSCAFFALGFLSRPDKEDQRWSPLCHKMLQGSAQLLGFVTWGIQREEANSELRELLHKLDTAEKEIRELKQIRREDAKANEKVVGIFASQEQGWLIERKKFRQHIGALMNELQILEKNKEDAVSKVNNKLRKMELLLQSKDKALEEGELKRKELEEKLTKAESIAEEIRETAKLDAQGHSVDLWKHKTAFLELVSNQRQLEAEMSRTLRKLEAERQELDSALEQKEESVLLAQKLSMEVVKMRKDLEQKEKILSAMLRKSKLDTSEKQMLLSEVKLSKAKRKEAKLETERRKAVSVSRHERHSLRSMLYVKSRSNDDPSVALAASEIVKGRSQTVDYVLENENPEFRKDLEVLSHRYCPEGNDKQAIAAEVDIKQLEGWVFSEAEKYTSVMEKRHHLEIDAFAEQMRVKDEKLEAFHWRLLSMEIESKRMQSHVQGLNQEMSQLRHENMKLEALLLERQEELNAMKEHLASQIKPQVSMSINLNTSPQQHPALAHNCHLSKAKAAKQRPIEKKEQEMKTDSTATSQENEVTKKEETISNQSKNVVQSPEKEFEEGKDVYVDEGRASEMEMDNVEAPRQPLSKTNNAAWRIDLQALGVSYKIKRLKQQLMMLERLTGKQGSEQDVENMDNSEKGMKRFLLLMPLLNKQVSRYETLQAKTDQLCQRVQDNEVSSRSGGGGDSSNGRRKGETKALEQFLEETFQLQRYMVTTGQKMMEVQTKMGAGVVGVPEMVEKFGSFDSKRFVDNMRSLFQDVQRGLEVRIARIIGDLEGTLACDGIIRIRR